MIIVTVVRFRFLGGELLFGFGFGCGFGSGGNLFAGGTIFSGFNVFAGSCSNHFGVRGMIFGTLVLPILVKAVT